MLTEKRPLTLDNEGTVGDSDKHGFTGVVGLKRLEWFTHRFYICMCVCVYMFYIYIKHNLGFKSKY